MPIATINPATGETLQTFTPLTDAQVQEKLQRAADAFQTHRRTSFADRAAHMTRAGEILEAEKQAIARTMTREVGKTLQSSVEEVEKCARACRYYAENAARFLADEPYEIDGARAFVRSLPLGPILAIMPWNFPLWQVIRFAAPALMAGNVGLLKHAENVPQCALAVRRPVPSGGLWRRRFPGAAGGNAADRRPSGRPARRCRHADRQRAGGPRGRGAGRTQSEKSGAGTGRQRPIRGHAERRSGRRGADRRQSQDPEQRPVLHRRQAVPRRGSDRRRVH